MSGSAKMPLFFCKCPLNDMYAVIATGGKQYRVEQGDILRVEKLDAQAGDTIDFDKVLMLGAGDEVDVGAPYIEGGKVSAEVLAQGRAKKIEIIKFKRRKHHRKQIEFAVSLPRRRSDASTTSSCNSVAV